MPTFGPASFDDDNRAASTGRLINCFRQGIVGRGRAQFALRSVLGTEAFADVGEVFFFGATEYKNDIYAAFDGSLIRVGSSGTVSSLGTISSGQTNLSSNNDYVTIAAGGTYFVYLGGITTPTVEPFSGVGSVGFLDQRTLLTENNGRKWAWSDLADPTTIPALNFATAEATDDNLLRVIGLNGRVVLFKETGREVWYNTGQSGADAFSRIAGGVRNVGLKAFGLVTRTDEALFWVGNDNICRLTLDGISEQKLSYPPVDTAISQGESTECFYYEDEGQKFCVVRFEDRPSWVFDLASAEWHERAYGPEDQAWPVRGTVRLGNTWYGLTNAGLVQRLTRNNTDVGTALRRVAVSETFYFPERASVDLIEIFGRVGFSDLDRDAMMWIRLSRDGGATWTLEKFRSLGGIGEHESRATWRSQGLARTLTIEAVITEPAEIPIWSDYRLEVA